MDKELQKEAKKQYLRYFRFWFVGVGIAFVIFLVGVGSNAMRDKAVRSNDSAPAERVYDYANVLTDEEEARLRSQIAEAEAAVCCDIVLVTIRQEVGTSDYEWENNMMNLADDFYDENYYGYNKVHGDGVLLLDNWYEGQAGSWLSTCGSVYEEFGSYEIDSILDAVYWKVEENPYKAYSTYVEEIRERMGKEEVVFPLSLLILPVIVMLIFVAVKLRSSFGKNTVSASTYVAGGRPTINVRNDRLVNKFVTKRIIPRSTGSSGGGSSGRGGSHRSSGGVRHGGGGRRR